jgi:hypothetical protein
MHFPMNSAIGFLQFVGRPVHEVCRAAAKTSFFDFRASQFPMVVVVDAETPYEREPPILLLLSHTPTTFASAAIAATTSTSCCFSI